MRKHHDVRNITFEGEFIILTIDGQERRFRLSEISPLLLRASDHERNAFEVSPSGYGVHWSLIDEDLSIDGLLGISSAPEWQQKIA
jgi:hypothetical protein